MEAQQHPEDLVAAYVLGATGPDETAEVEQHLATCAQCRRLEQDLRAVESLLPNLADEVEPSTALKSRLMAAIAQEPPRQQTPDDAPPPTPPIAFAERAQARRAAPNRSMWLAVAAMLALIVAGALIYRQRNTAEQPTRQYAVAGTPAMRSVRGTIKYYQSGQKLQLDLQGLKAIPGSKVYELWLIHATKSGKLLSALGVTGFRPSADGTATVTLSGHDVPAYQLAGLTVERAPLSRVPTLPIVATASLS
jgi:anti-sigma-K factor RskA